LNFISFTPATSFQLASNTGRADERVLLFWLLESVWKLKGVAARNVLQGNVRADRFREMLDQFPKQTRIDPALRQKFTEAIIAREVLDNAADTPSLRDRFEDLCERFGRVRMHIPKEDRRDQNRLIGDMRALLASTCIRALEPDLVILDEFQRFKDLLTVEEDADSVEGDEATLARELFNYSNGSEKTRILLLSATPYKMYTTIDELGTDDHYADFLQTLRFLNDDPSRSTNVERILHEYRRAIQRLGSSDQSDLQQMRERLEFELRRVMVRTERLSSSPDRNGMLREVPCDELALTVDDALTYRSLQQLARQVQHNDTVEYWKASPYLLSFMDDYVFKRDIADSEE
jgi:hypothetical protein